MQIHPPRARKNESGASHHGAKKASISLFVGFFFLLPAHSLSSFLPSFRLQKYIFSASAPDGFSSCCPRSDKMHLCRCARARTHRVTRGRRGKKSREGKRKKKTPYFSQPRLISSPTIGRLFITSCRPSWFTYRQKTRLGNKLGLMK